MLTLIVFMLPALVRCGIVCCVTHLCVPFLWRLQRCILSKYMCVTVCMLLIYQPSCVCIYAASLRHIRHNYCMNCRMRNHRKNRRLNLRRYIYSFPGY